MTNSYSLWSLSATDYTPKRATKCLRAWSTTIKANKNNSTWKAIAKHTSDRLSFIVVHKIQGIDMQAIKTESHSVWWYGDKSDINTNQIITQDQMHLIYRFPFPESRNNPNRMIIPNLTIKLGFAFQGEVGWSTSSSLIFPPLKIHFAISWHSYRL